MNSKAASLAATAGPVCLIGLVLFSGTPLNYDCALYLQCAQLILHGHLPYIDYVETNPPLVHYIHIVPVALAQWLGLNLAMTFQVIVLALVLYSSFLLFLIPSKSATGNRPNRFFLVGAWLGFSIFVYASGGFGQREHLFMLAYLPWFYCRIARYEDVPMPQSLSLPVGVLAGLFFLIKPQFLLLVLIVELWMLYRTRRASVLSAPEVILVAGITFMYGVHL